MKLKIRYINLLNRVAKIKTKRCFIYNNTVIFAVPSELVSRAIGPNGRNVREIQEKSGRRIRIIKDADGLSDAERFVEDIVEPIAFVSIEVKDNKIILTAGTRSKAALLGRNKRRSEELYKIVEETFGKELRIV